ncbi:hypothetical protein [uncultured Gemella sp.]|uniref:hypothetical protein n=1 Tax=uncultured Gemella sp. TaxID=254352 RepID=UPI0028D3C625|nr:hypothetical protein [uncultured Gemella sp.]
MGKIFKGALLGAISAIGAYYYKNPKELEKHKELLKENARNGIDRLTEIVNDKIQELEAQAQEEKDLAKEKLEELTASEEVAEVEESFVELGAKAKEVKEEVVAEVTETVEDVREATEPAVEQLEGTIAPVVEEVKEIVVPAAEPAFEKMEEVVENVKEAAVERYEEKVEPTFEEIHEAVAPVIEKAEEVHEELEEEVEEKPKTTLDSIVSLFASKEGNK